MRGVDLGIIIALVVAVAGGTAYVVQIRAEVDELRRRVELVAPLETIMQATEEAVNTLRDAGLIQFDQPLRFSTGGRGRNNEPLIPVGKGICYLTRVTGDFNGNGEWAHVRPTDDGYWNLQTDSRMARGPGPGYTLRLTACVSPPRLNLRGDASVQSLKYAS